MDHHRRRVSNLGMLFLLEKGREIVVVKAWLERENGEGGVCGLDVLKREPGK